MAHGPTRLHSVIVNDTRASDDLHALRRMQSLSISQLEKHMTFKSVHVVPTSLQLPRDTDLTLLSLGTKFVPSASLTQTRTTNLAAAARFSRDQRLRSTHLRPLELTQRRHLSASLQQAMFRNTARTPRSIDNLTKTQRKTLRTLCNSTSYVTLNADKNLGLTIMSTEWYTQQARNHLNDPTTYRLVEDWPRARRHITIALKRMDPMPWPTLHATSASVNKAKQRARSKMKQQRETKQASSATTSKHNSLHQPCRFYVIPKVHKTPVSSRPIAAAHSFLTTPLSQRLTPLLQHMVTQHAYIVPNSTEFLRMLSALPTPLSANTRLFTADVESLYPNIDTDFALTLLNAPVIDAFGPVHGPTVNCALDIVMRSLHVQFRNDIFLQVSGCAMGTPVAPPYANLFLHHADKMVRTEFAAQLPLLVRYIDDYAGLWSGTDEEYQRFVLAMNSLHPRLRIIFSPLSVSTSFLDVHVTLVNGYVCTKLFRKAMNRYLFLPLSSEHPQSTLTGWLQGEAIRAARICSSLEAFEREITFFRLLLRHRGYPPMVIDRALSRVSYHNVHAQRFTQRPQVTTVETVPPTVYLPLLFQPRVARAIKRTLPNARLWNAKVAWRISPSLGQLLSKQR